MQWNKRVYIFLAILFALSSISCGIERASRIYNSPSGATNVSGVYWFPQNHENNVARARYWDSLSSLNYAQAEKIRTGEGIGYNYGFKNRSLSKTLYLINPETNATVPIPPQQIVIFQMEGKHRKVEAYFAGAKKTRMYRVYSSQLVKNGVKIDFGADIKG